MYNETPIGKIKSDLFEAAINNNYKKVKKLLKVGTSDELRIDDETLNSLIAYCVNAKAYSTLDWIFRAEYKFSDSWGLIASMLAGYEIGDKKERNEILKTVETIITYGEIDLQGSQWTDIIPVLDYVEIMNMFLKLGADPNCTIEINHKHVENPSLEKYLEANLIINVDANSDCLIALRAYKAIINEKKNLESTLLKVEASASASEDNKLSASTKI